MERLKNTVQRIKELLMPCISMFTENNMPVYSGYATLFIVTAVIPFIILIIAVVNLIPGYSAENVAEILLQILPDLEPVKDLVLSLFTEIEDQSGGLLASVAAVTTLLSASKGVMAIQKGLDRLDSSEEDSGAYREEAAGTAAGGLAEKGAAFVKSILKRLVYTLTLIILIPAMMVLEIFEEYIAEITGSNLISYIGAAMVILAAFLVTMQLFAKLPEKHRTIRSQLTGAVLTVFCWWAFTELFAFFISMSHKYSNVYGSLAAVFLLLLWLRYMIMILFGGAVLNRVLEEKR